MRELPDIVDIKILVDDSSKDKTALLPESLGVQTFIHDANYGYGRNQQTCYREALAAGADIVVMVHPDYQYTPALVPAMAGMVASGVYDMVLASRILGGGALKGGMPFYKYISNRLLTAFQNLVSRGKALGVPHRIPGLFARAAADASAAREFRRLCLRQPDDRSGRDVRLPNRRDLLSDEILQGSLLDQLQTQREIWNGRVEDDSQFRGAQDGDKRIPLFDARGRKVTSKDYSEVYRDRLRKNAPKQRARRKDMYNPRRCTPRNGR